MEGVDNMEVVFRGRGQEARFNKLAERQIDLTCYPHQPTMVQLGIEESVLHLLNQVGWTGYCGVVFFTSPFHLGGRHAKPFTRNLEGECARGGMNFVSVLPTISHELSYLSYE